MFECRSATGQYDVHVELRASIQQLVGRNEELRHELQRARDESTNFAVVVNKQETKVFLVDRCIGGNHARASTVWD